MKVKKHQSNGVLATTENNGESQLGEENAMVIIKK
jgi:hypothetical protein